MLAPRLIEGRYAYKDHLYWSCTEIQPAQYAFEETPAGREGHWGDHVNQSYRTSGLVAFYTFIRQVSLWRNFLIHN